MQRLSYFLSCFCLIALIFLGIAWETRLAPLHVGGSALVFKVLPLFLPLFGLLNARRYTYQWSILLILFYFAEGLVRATSEEGASQALALVEVVLSLLFFIAAISYLRVTRL